MSVKGILGVTSLLAMATSADLGHRTGIASFPLLSREALNRPSDPRNAESAARRKEKRRAKMRLRKLRGYVR